ncbi:hypothetical protein [Polyangium aurulentum]|uniref:hypothetical protein n=1 Tax=Polyangium aurulentum TaxID=2567896 RepID=UPI0010AEBB5F|nr:hypothetical protein [Polyangium aurulentum]UQA59463.1 hypothetical protein E8A73_002840 [Polyangium aurulentum]
MSHLVAGSATVTLVVAVVFCVIEARKARRAARQANEVAEKPAPLAPGAHFVAGDVELAQGEDVAVRVTVTQVGSETQTRSGHTHGWSESQRTVEANPFYLRHESGARIRVEPPENVILVDALDQMEWWAKDRRRQRAELTAGEEAMVEGTLQRGHDPEAMQSGGYRDPAALGWVMKPAADGRMHISTEDLTRRHVLRARAFDKTLVLVILLGVVAQVALTGYWQRVFYGEDIVASYLNKQMYETRDGKGNVIRNHAIRIEFGKGESRWDVDPIDYSRLPDSGGEIWVRHVPEYPEATALGRGSSVGMVSWVIAVACAAVSAYLTRSTHRYRRWYDGKLVESGEGRLPEPPNIRFTHIQRPDVASPQAAPRKKKRRRAPKS